MAAERLKLYGYWRSSAAYRVRIALNLKGLPYEIAPVHLTENGGAQHADAFRKLNPQELIPVLVDGERIVRQSLAIIEYLEEAYEGNAKLLPTTVRERARQLAAIDLARSVVAGAMRTVERRDIPALAEAHAELSRLAAQAPTYNYDAGLLVMEIGSLLAALGAPSERAHG